VFVADASVPVLDGDDRHHLTSVLRLRDGDPITVGDGAGTWGRAVFRSEAEPESTADVVVVPEAESTVAVGFALIKGGRPELVVQKLTELGVDRILPLTAERSVVRWDDDQVTAQVERFRRVAREAAMQSRRVWLPEIEEVSVAGDVAAANNLAMAEPGGDPIDGSVRVLLIGPEDGWTRDELAVHQTVVLARTVLRAETAAIVAGTLLTAIRDGRVSPPA
jgi:16S rRNA (uracil1498-N3)-methyltransferase